MRRRTKKALGLYRMTRGHVEGGSLSPNDPGTVEADEVSCSEGVPRVHVWGRICTVISRPRLTGSTIANHVSLSQPKATDSPGITPA